MDLTLEFPSLQKIALVKISSILWNQRDIKMLIEEQSNRREKWENLEKKVREKVLKLPGLGLYRKEIMSFIRPMGLQILKWTRYHLNSWLTENTYLSVHVPTEFLWTPHGTIDRKETAKLILKDPTIDAAQNNKLACIYCLEGSKKRECRYMVENFEFPTWMPRDNSSIVNDYDILSFWLNVDRDLWLCNELGSNGYAFINAVKFNNKVAAEYFFQRLIARNKDACMKLALDVCLLQITDKFLVQVVQAPPDVEVLCFLLSKLTNEKFLEALKKKPEGILKCMLEWPFACFYVKMANYYWDYLSTQDLIFPLKPLVNCKLYRGFEDTLYKQIFRELWKSACKRFGADLKTLKNLESLFFRLFAVKDKENIAFIFQDVSPAIRKPLILSVSGFFISVKLVKQKEWNLLRFFIQKCLHTKSEIREYKKKLTEFALHHPGENFNVNAEMGQFFKYIEERHYKVI